MKKSLHVLLLAVAFPLIFAACTREENAQNFSTLSATVDATAFVPGTFKNEVISNTGTKQLNIAATSDSSSIMITIPNYTEELAKGTYDLSTTKATASYNGNAAKTGQVEIKSASGSFVNGTFSFVTQAGVQVTDGKFSVVIQR